VKKLDRFSFAFLSKLGIKTRNKEETRMSETDPNTAVVILLVGAFIYILVFVYWIKQTTANRISARPNRFKRRSR
jgi:hypothetical protein